MPADAEQVVNRDLNPLLRDLPAWCTRIEPHQVRAVRHVLDGFTRHRLVFLDAPTGSGKTLVAEVVRRMLRAKGLYVCTTKRLQDQFAKDFPSARVVMGRGNYPTELMEQDWPELSCEDCARDESCTWCSDVEQCPYVVAKRTAAEADVAVLNASYLLMETRNPMSPFRNRRLVTFDEADTLEQEVMRSVSVEVSERRMRRWGWEPPAKVTVESAWEEWLGEHIDRLKGIKAQHNARAKDKGWYREADFLDGLSKKMRDVREGLGTGAWVYTGRDGHGVSFRPSRVDALCGPLWDVTKTGLFLLMSATPISVEERLESLGWREGFAKTVVAHTFPVANRRVRFQPVVGMGAKTKDMAVMAEAVNKVIDNHPTERVLVHTVSYANSNEMQRLVKQVRTDPRPILTYEDSRGGQTALKKYLSMKNAVLLAPSMARGVDLPDEACRVQVLIKVPYPYLGDRQVSARLHSRGGRLWYTCETVRTLVQMCGRGVRHVGDHAATYILDSDFERLWTSGRGLFPGWFVESIVWRPER